MINFHILSKVFLSRNTFFKKIVEPSLWDPVSLNQFDTQNKSKGKLIQLWIEMFILDQCLLAFQQKGPGV